MGAAAHGQVDSGLAPSRREVAAVPHEPGVEAVVVGIQHRRGHGRGRVGRDRMVGQHPVAVVVAGLGLGRLEREPPARQRRKGDGRRPADAARRATRRRRVVVATRRPFQRDRGIRGGAHTGERPRAARVAGQRQRRAAGPRACGPGSRRAPAPARRTCSRARTARRRSSARAGAAAADGRRR